MYRPHRIATRQFTLQNKTLGAVYNAERDIQRLDSRIKYSPYADAVRKTLIRGDGLGVLNIKSLWPSIYSVMRVETAAYLYPREASSATLGKVLEKEKHDTIDSAIEAFHFMEATEWITNNKNHGSKFSPHDMLQLNAYCEDGLFAKASSASFRTGSFNEEKLLASGLDYFPPEAQELNLYLEDFCEFINTETLTPLCQASIAQFQFEAIRPFEGNLDRTERLLIDYIFSRRKLVESILFPINFFAAHSKEKFYEYLSPYLNTPGGNENSTLPYVEKLILHTTIVSYELLQFIMTLHQLLVNLVDRWRMRLGRVDKGSAVEMLLYKLAGTPILTIAQACDFIGKSFSATSDALDRLVKAGVVTLGYPIRRNKTFEARDAILLHDGMYRQNVPEGSKVQELSLAQRA